MSFIDVLQPGYSVNPVLQIIFAISQCGREVKSLSTGVYVNCGFNFENMLRDNNVSCECFYHDDIPNYGVVDSAEQFIAKFGKLIEADEHFYAVGFTEILKSEQSPEGGWRWNKWGEYYGSQQKTCEYLHDEPLIERVSTFEVFRVNVEECAG